MRAKFVFASILFLLAHGVAAQQKPNLPNDDRVRLAEAFRLGDAVGNRVWKGWDKAPFAVLLVTPDDEFLIRHPAPSKDFTLIGYDSLLRSNVYFRKRTEPLNLQATFPAVNGSSISTIVIGEAERTQSKTSTPWVVTVFHEHFHQLQYSQADYFAGVDALNLSRGDRTGMWMLNYAFPYHAPEVKQQFDALSRLLVEAIQTRNKKDLTDKANAYMEARRKFNALLAPDDYKYLSFQLWQEGVARYTEYRLAESAAREYRPGKAFRALKDYKPFKEVADETLQRTLRQLTAMQFDHSQREAVYSFGAGEALLLDRLNPKWRERYFIEMFYLDNYFNAPRQNRAPSRK
jgi:hypothetical protein